MPPDVYAIRYAHREAVRRPQNFHGGDSHDGAMPMSYFTWLIAGDDACVVVDTGFSERTAAKRPGRDLLADQGSVLRGLGVDVEEVRDVVLTHLHFDHAGGLDRFPAARFWVQDAEMAFWTGRHGARRGFLHSIEPEDIVSAVKLNFERRLVFVDGDAEVGSGISVHGVGGHSAGLQVVRVQTPSGVLVLASDAAHYYENIETDRPFSTIHSLADMYGAFDRVRALAGPGGTVVPGHDPLVMERFPAVAGLEGIAVRLDAGA
ncbi:MAG: N-acyl homoserine lactonase family protein [Solirubrobacteraceae bacterium]